MAYLFLAFAIIGEVIGTAYLKTSEGFSKLTPSLIAILSYSVTFYFLSLSLKTIPTGIAYAIWAAAGIILIAAVGWFKFGQKLDMPAMIGIGFILAGVLIIHLFSKSVSH